MDEFSSRFDNTYPLQSEYIGYDTNQYTNPGIHKQHLSPFGNDTYRSAPPHQLSADINPQPLQSYKVSTFSLEDRVHKMSKYIDYIFYMNILLVVLIMIVVICTVIPVLYIGVTNKRAG